MVATTGHRHRRIPERADEGDFDQGLVEAFGEDHRRMTQGIEELTRLLEEGDVGAAVGVAERLDREAGAHIEFEERVFYPFLRSRLDDSAVDRFYREHEAGRHAVDTIRRLDPDAPLDASRRERLLDELQTARDHALSCGTLVSHLQALAPAEVASMRAELERARRAGRRWSAADGAGA